MQTITLKIDDSIYQKFLNIIELFPKSKLKIAQHSVPCPNQEVSKAIKDIENGKNCETFSTVDDMFKTYSM